MSGSTVKLDGWTPQRQPEENNGIKAYRQLIVNVVFSLYHRKKEILKSKQMPPQPIKLREIYLELQSRVTLLHSVGEWNFTRHGKRWIDRRVNEAASPKFYLNGVPKIVSARAGLYLPNPALFMKVK